VHNQNEIQIALNAIDQAKRRLSPSDRCCADMHDKEVFEVTLNALQQKRGKLLRIDHFARRVVSKDLRRRINRERSRYQNWECAFDERSRSTESYRCPASREDPVADACQKEWSDRLNHVLRQLPSEQENVLRSLYLSNNCDQILILARRLAVTRQTVARWRDLGLTTLKRLLLHNAMGC
jgi:DNA-directed RNA polymerase sigma subunit (sigma70/sigma32)